MWKNALCLKQHFGVIRQLPSKCLGSELLQTEPTAAIYNQSRTTFILKRKWPPGLSKKNQRPKKLNARHFVYDLVEDTNIKKQEDLTVVLTSYVEGIGKSGDVVSLRPNFAYEKLLLPGLAVYASPENLAAIPDEPAASTATDEEHSSAYAQRTVNVLSTKVMAIVMNLETPWVVERWHVRASLRKAGVHVPEDAIELPETPITGPNLALENKQFYVTVTVNNLEKVQVPCRIHHWSTQPSDRLPFVEQHWLQPAEPIQSSPAT